MLRGGLRLSAFALSTIAYIIILGALRLLEWASLSSRIRTLVLPALFSRLLLKLFKIKVRTENSLKTQQPTLIVCNHLSYLDALVISSKLRANFITSTEIKETAGLGLLCRLAGCLFVDRQSIWKLKKEIQGIASHLKAGRSVVLFPEGTTSQGLRVGPYKSSLFESAALAGTPVVSLALKVERIGDAPANSENLDLYSWYGDMDFLPHLKKLCRAPEMTVSLMQLETILPSSLKTWRKVAAKKSHLGAQRQVDKL